MDDKEIKDVKQYDPNVNTAGYAHVPIGQKVEPVTQKTEMVTNPPYVTPELGDAPEEMQKEADRIYKGLRGVEGPFHEETPAARESASRVMWTTLEKSWTKGKDGKWVKKEKSE
jgi:hypothetical protein